ncbi:hypothetical protein BDR03DRAFT_979872 [Suillus americanus]|nr:hypothetical protein BDR03DRAFT_979872 [Suillus americanus]
MWIACLPLRACLESIQAQLMKLNVQWALDKKPAIRVSLAHITSEGPEVDWRHITTGEVDIPVLFDLYEPEHGLIQAGKSINPRKRLFSRHRHRLESRLQPWLGTISLLLPPYPLIRQVISPLFPFLILRKLSHLLRPPLEWVHRDVSRL